MYGGHRVKRTEKTQAIVRCVCVISTYWGRRVLTRCHHPWQLLVCHEAPWSGMDPQLPLVRRSSQQTVHLCHKTRLQWTTVFIFFPSKCILMCDPSKESWGWRTPAFTISSPAEAFSNGPKVREPDELLHWSMYHSGTWWLRNTMRSQTNEKSYYSKAACNAQTLASLDGAGTKIQILFDLSVVNYSLCIRLEDNGANKNCWVQRHSRHGRRGARKGVVESPLVAWDREGEESHEQ